MAQAYDPDERKPEDTKEEEAEQVGLEGLAPNSLGETREDEDIPPAEETRTPYDEG